MHNIFMDVKYNISLFYAETQLSWNLALRGLISKYLAKGVHASEIDTF